MNEDDVIRIPDERFAGVHVETIDKPMEYSHFQLEYACGVAYALRRGKFVLCEKPR